MNYESSRSARQRRALNIIWSAAGSYDFRPEFTAYQRNGEPDLYLNSIVGFVHRHYETERLSSYVHETLDHSLLRELFTELLWLGLEQAAYEKELPKRSVLAELRQAHARQYLKDDIDLSMQQLMMRNEIVHTLKCGRCHEILHEPTGIRNPWDQRLYEALRFSGNMTTEDILFAMQDIIRRFFLFQWTNPGRKSFHLALPPRLLALMRKYLPMQKRRSDTPGSGLQPVFPQSGTFRSASGRTFEEENSRKTEEELCRLFGAPLFNIQHLAGIEAEFCRGIHENARLWFTADAGKPNRQNLDWYAAHRAQYRTGMLHLRDAIQNCLMVHRQPMTLLTRHGELRPGQVWRGLYLHDTRVFSAAEHSSYGNFSVLLLLDASCSRESQQPVIAAQAYIIAEALRLSGIPIAIASFYSLHGYTVIRRMKDFSDASSEHVFHYTANGWNRDGLAFRAVPELMRNAVGKTLLLILTDAYPSDDLNIPARGIHLSQSYVQEPAVEDTAQAVRELKQRGIQVIGIIHSVFSDGIVADYAKKIYGEDYTRITRISMLAQAVGELLQKQIQGL